MTAADTPDGAIRQFMACFGARDLDAAVALYEPDATFVSVPGNAVSGLAAIRASLEAFLAMKPTLVGDLQSVTEAGDTALVCNHWRLTGTAPDGSDILQTGRSADVLRRRADGSWGILIDNPWAAPPPDAPAP